jgi:hypothetical protein
VSARLNPLEEALRLASQSLMFCGRGPDSAPVNTEASVVKALAAQALATVALVEEQRTANLLAYLATLELGPKRRVVLAEIADRLGVPR